ncbi:MAG: nucleotidyltransferase family protein [Roseiarcus sp.]
MEALTAVPNARLLASFLNGSWRRECPPLCLTPAEVARAAPLLIGSGAAALGWRRIKDTPALKGCAEAQELCQSGQLLALEDSRLDRALEFVAARLNEVGIAALIAKGWAVAHFYSSRYLRAYGDFDLCAPPGRYELAHETLRRLTPPGFSAAETGDIFVDCGPDLGHCTVDLHKNFGAAHMPAIEALHARSTRAKAGSADIRLLAFEDHLRFVVTHLLVHGAWRPSGLCDVAAMVEAIPPDFDWALCLGDDEVVARWIGATIMLAHRLLGCSLDAVPPALRVDPPAWLERAVLREWEAPYPGRFRSVAASGLAKHPGQLLHWLRVRWPNPVEALIEARLPVNSPRRLAHQAAIFARRMAKGSIEYLSSALPMR